MYSIIGADGRQYGPITADQLRQWIAEGRANAQSQVLAEGAAEWKPLGQFPEFASALTGIPRPGTIGPIPTAPRNNPMAVAGLILGIISITVGLCCCHGLPFNLLGIVFSVIGLSQIKEDPDGQQGRGLAIAGLVLSILSLVVAGLMLALAGVMSSSHWFQSLPN